MGRALAVAYSGSTVALRMLLLVMLVMMRVRAMETTQWTLNS
jgi:hypothetical protein